MENIILPVINSEDLQKKANEYAQKGAEEVLKEFYTGYKSPYKTAIEENLKGKGVDFAFDLPDIVGVINEKFSAEIDKIANTAVAKSFLPLLKQFLVREDPDVKFSDILKVFIKVSGFENDDDLEVYNYELTREEDTSKSYVSSFFEYKITNGKIGYELRFHKSSDRGTTIMSLPYMMDDSKKYTRQYSSTQKMKVSLDGGATLELPFTKGVLEDEFVSFIARLVIGNNNILFDVEDFDEDMFPRDHCHCD